MRIYIIGNDGITLCREAPATVNEGEIVVASKEELHAARLGGKRLLALWNALPGVEKRRKVGDREALDRSAVVRGRGPARPGPTVRDEGSVKAGGGDRHAAAARGRNCRGSRERYGVAAAHGSRSLLGNPEEEARACACFGARRSAAGSTASPSRRAHETSNPRCVGSPVRWRAVARSRSERQPQPPPTKAEPERYRSRNRRLTRSIDQGAAACLAQVASHRTAFWD